MNVSSPRDDAFAPLSPHAFQYRNELTVICESRSVGARSLVRRTAMEGGCICYCHETIPPQFGSPPPARTGPTECDDTAADA